MRRVRLGAIQAVFDRGWGKAVQHTEAEISVYDRLSLAEQQALLAALDELELDPQLEAAATIEDLLPPPTTGRLNGSDTDT